VPNGSCSSDLDCINPENSFPTARCLGYLYCDQGSCARKCGSACKNEEKLAKCKNDACEANPCEEGISCVQNYCGGCSAIHFDGSGNQVCFKDVEPTDNEFCESERDCSKREYCRSGVCVPNGSCSSDLDCINPENSFPTARCLGYLYCDQGSCARKCGSACKNEEKRALCNNDACEANPCEEGISCVRNYCGGCSAIHFDGLGNRVCFEDGDIIDKGNFDDYYNYDDIKDFFQS